ncbi:MULTISPECIES: GNAT family N-acetyltransferase [Bacteroidales]|uniref:GNAT family N-acetyltransferase n=1 Tax=Bacteroidales TaxID=171549 RepID=UPI001EF1FBA9|nr:MULTISPECIES: GNAT family N-acetyltransferase [Bacteroidales]
MFSTSLYREIRRSVYRNGSEKPKPVTDFAIEVDGKAVGGIGIVLNAEVERITAEIGYWLGERYWGRGIMTSVVTEMVDYTFASFPVIKIYAPVFNLISPRNGLWRKPDSRKRQF